MATPSRRTRPALLIAGTGLAIVLVALVAAGVGLSRREEAQPLPEAPRVTTRDVQAALDEAKQALLRRDRTAWDAALPASSGAARRAASVLYRRLAPLPWTDLRLMAEAVSGRPGRFYVGAVGEIGDAGPADRIMARRVFDAGLRGGRLVLVDDITPRDLRRQDVMAFDQPVAVRGNGLVVIADGRERAAAEALVAAGAPARERLGLLGVSAGEPIVVYYYSSRRQLLRSLGEDPGEARIRFFSHAPRRLRDVPTGRATSGCWAPPCAARGPGRRGCLPTR